MLHYDLHCHSTCSDGLLPPGEVVARAAANGVGVLALTDHDDLSGLPEARTAAFEAGIRLVSGAELSTCWGDVSIHVVALGIDAENPELARGLEGIRDGRRSRARRIGESLADAGIARAHEGALRYVGTDGLVTRTHFARYLVEIGRARDMKNAFERYLTRGKPGYVAHEWAALSQAVKWIRVAGGQAVLAHPGRYKVDSRGMRRLLGDFRDAGGDAIEVLSGAHTAAQCDEYARQARVFGLKASCGSDFHGPGESATDLGGLPPLPAGVIPVWQDW